MEENKNNEFELASTSDAQVPAEVKPEETVSEVAEEIIEEDAKEIEQPAPKPQLEKNPEPKPEVKPEPVQDKPEPEAGKDFTLPGTPDEEGGSKPPKMPKAPRPKTPWTRTKICMTVCFALAALSYLVAGITAIISTAKPVIYSLDGYNEEYDRGERDLDDFFDRDYDFDFDFGNDGYDYDAFEYQSSALPMRSNGAFLEVSQPAQPADYSASFAWMINGTIFGCTGILLLCRKDEQ